MKKRNRKRACPMGMADKAVLVGILLSVIAATFSIAYGELRAMSEDSRVVVFDRSEEKEVGALVDPGACGSPDRFPEESGAGDGRDSFPVNPPSEREIREEVERVFGMDSEVALAIFRTESALKPDNKNWNCHYYREDGTRYSDICRPEDRDKAWSVDCGIAQVNVPGKECPADLFDYRRNIRVAKGIFDKGGFERWVTYQRGYYLANL